MPGVGHDRIVLILGHRGASVAQLENTPAAFATADAMGADGVELDVRRVGDGRLLVAHDPLPESMAEIDALGCASFDEVLDSCGERMLVNVEIKNWRADRGYDPTMAMVGPVIDALRRRGAGSLDRWLISSFSWETLAACRAFDPAVATAFLTFGEVDESLIARVAAAGHVALHPSHDTVDAALIERCHGAGLAANAWTCNDPTRLAELAALGLDGVCTDVPDVALAALGRSGPTLHPSWR